MSLLTDEIDRWELPQWVLESGDQLWLDIKATILRSAYDDNIGLFPNLSFCYGICPPNGTNVNLVDMRVLTVESILNDRGVPDVNLTVSFIYNTIKRKHPDRTITVK